MNKRLSIRATVNLEMERTSEKRKAENLATEKFGKEN